MEHTHARRGFTLIELLVVLAIILIVTAVVITSQSSFNKTVILENTAYDIALAMRSAENFGLGSRAAGNTENAGYGVHFDASKPNSFILFADTDPPVGTPGGNFCHAPVGVYNGPGALPGDCLYTPSKDLSVNTYTLGNGIVIKDLCADNANTGWGCINVSLLDIVFARPNGDATISINGSFNPPPSPYTNACLAVTSPQGGYQSILVDELGEINVSTSPCP